MPVKAELREEGQVIYFKITDPWTPEEVFAGFGQTQAMRDTIYKEDPQRRVHTLVDLTEIREAPPGALRTRRAPGITHPNRGEYVVAASYPFAREIMITVFKVMRIDGKLFNTLDEAWAYLRPFLQPAQPSPAGHDEPKTAPKTAEAEDYKSGGSEQ